MQATTSDRDAVKAIHDFQARNAAWAKAAFHGDPTDVRERVNRFVEEALELAQSLGQTADEAHQVVNYVQSRPAGVPRQELGGVMTTAALLANRAGLDMLECGEEELARVSTPAIMAKVREKRSKRFGRGALPGTHSPDFTPGASIPATTDMLRDPWLETTFVPMAARGEQLAIYADEVVPGMDPGDTEAPADLATMLADGRVMAWFAVRDRQVVGWCALAPRHGKYAEGAWHLYGCWVRDDMRRRGLALAMWRLRVATVPFDAPVTVSIRPGIAGSERLAEEFGFEALGDEGPWANRVLRRRA